jgi:regulator of cell morphogenesis and NO signaling
MEALATGNRPGIKISEGFFAADIEKTIEDTIHQQSLTEASENYYKMHSFDFNRWPADFLADYIYNEHHCYYYEQERALTELMDKVVNLYGTNNEVLQRLKGLYRNLRNGLTQHMLREERVLFPYIKSLAIAKRNSSFPMPCGISTILTPINAMETEHEVITDILQEIKTITNGYTPLGNAGNSLRLLYNKLQALENDIYQHIYLETSILFPKAIAVEKELMKLKLI